jgi:succinyl-CoA synthetase beta subunit
MGDAIKVPIIVRLQGTNAAKKLIDNSGMPIYLQLNFKKQQIK